MTDPFVGRPIHHGSRAGQGRMGGQRAANARFGGGTAFWVYGAFSGGVGEVETGGPAASVTYGSDSPTDPQQIHPNGTELLAVGHYVGGFSPADAVVDSRFTRISSRQLQDSFAVSFTQTWNQFPLVRFAGLVGTTTVFLDPPAGFGDSFRVGPPHNSAAVLWPTGVTTLASGDIVVSVWAEETDTVGSPLDSRRDRSFLYRLNQAGQQQASVELTVAGPNPFRLVPEVGIALAGPNSVLAYGEQPGEGVLRLWRIDLTSGIAAPLVAVNDYAPVGYEARVTALHRIGDIVYAQIHTQLEVG